MFDREAHFYQGQTQLDRPERVLLESLRGQWSEIDMLDLGVGAGRTAYTFAAVARSYVGIDLSPKMISLARQLVAESDHVAFRVGDARDLSDYKDASFGLVLFSYNGIDCVDHAGRLQILVEIRRVLKDDGCVVMSSHSLAYLPFPVSFPWPRIRNPLRFAVRLARDTRRALRLMAVNRSLDLSTARERGWAITRDSAHDFSLNLYYALPTMQLQQLAECGLRVTDVLDLDGSPVEPREPGRNPWLTYFCRPVL